MGSLEAYQTHADRRYRVLYRRPDHLQTQKRGFRTKRDAELYLAGIEVDKSRGAYIDPTKARATIGEWYEHRSIPIPDFLVEMQRRQVADRNPSNPVFYGRLTKTYLRNHAFRKGGIDPASTRVGLGGLTPHELGHTAASLAVSSGAHVKAVQRMLGHASAAMTLDANADPFDDDLDSVATALDANELLASVAALIPAR